MMIILLIGIGFLFLGLIFVVISINHKINNKNLLKKCISSTTAKFDNIQELYLENADNTKKSYFPIYKYYVNNKEYSFRGFGQENKELLSKNDITIYYNPNKPEESYEKTDIKKDEKTIKLFLLLGILFLFISIILFIVYKYNI